MFSGERDPERLGSRSWSRFESHENEGAQGRTHRDIGFWVIGQDTRKSRLFPTACVTIPAYLMA